MVELPFEWVDFGTWESLGKYLSDHNMMQSDGETIELDSTNNVVRAKRLALIGVNDMIIVDKDDALLICKKEMSGRVGEIVDKLKAEEKMDLV